MIFDPNPYRRHKTRGLSSPTLRGMASTMSPVEQTVILNARKILQRHLNQNPILSNWQSLMDYCAVTVRGPEERFHVIYLDSKNRVISDEQLAIGTVDHVPVYPREVLKRALVLNATALILVHNHPSGDPTPSEADVAMTLRIKCACDHLGIVLHDHVVVGGATEVSFRGLRLL